MCMEPPKANEGDAGVPLNYMHMVQRQTEARVFPTTGQRGMTEHGPRHSNCATHNKVRREPRS